LAAEKKPFFIHEPAGAGRFEGVLLILWHGAGGDVDEQTIMHTARAFSSEGAIAARARFPYRLEGRRMPDCMPKLMSSAKETVRAIQDATHSAQHRLVLGGRSMGGRVASMIAAEGFAADGLLFLSYPLHPAGEPEKLRSAHLGSIACPMLFVVGDRDELSELELLKPVLETLGARATLALYPGADHSLRQVDPETIAQRSIAWAAGLIGAR
jgi:predicted alpha/beta-hydrolase family hydrolase